VFQVGGSLGQSAIDFGGTILQDRVIVELHSRHDLVFVD
jgi:hypothetical protein